MKITHNRDYKVGRVKEYPPIGDQLDVVYKLAKTLQGSVELPQEVINWITKLDYIKNKYPKS